MIVMGSYGHPHGNSSDGKYLRFWFRHSGRPNRIEKNALSLIISIVPPPAKLVVILGAGASADFGVPTLSNLFKDRWSRTYLSENQWLLGHMREIFWEPRGYDLDTSEQSLTIEEILTVLRDCEQEKSITPKLCGDELAKFRKSLYVLIQRAVFYGKSSRGEYLNPLLQFAAENFSQTTWASFNWDCIFESSFWYWSGPRQGYHRRNPSLVISPKDWKSGTMFHYFLKLHGGINWWMINGKLTYLPFTSGGPLEAQWSKYSTADAPGEHPVILEPSYYKYSDETYKILEPQWDFFLKALVEACYILIVGYSLPSADGQARSKMMTAFQANPNSLWGVVDPNTETCAKYLRLFGHRRLKTFQNGLVGFNNNLVDNLQQLFPGLEPSKAVYIGMGKHVR